jgi:hypothetical protein
MSDLDFSPQNISKLFQEAVNKAIEQHRINGESIAVGENGEVKIISSQDIIPLSEKTNHSSVVKTD